MIGCNLAWGLVDAVMFLMSSLSERGNDIQTLRAVQTAPTPDAAHRVIVGLLPPVVASLFNRDDLEHVRTGLLGMTSAPAKPSLTKDDWAGALGVFLLVFLSTFPIVIPFCCSETFMSRFVCPTPSRWRCSSSPDGCWRAMADTIRYGPASP